MSSLLAEDSTVLLSLLQAAFLAGVAISKSWSEREREREGERERERERKTKKKLFSFYVGKSCDFLLC